MGATVPDGITYIDTGFSVTPSVESSNQATSIQAALSLRQRYEFVWPDAVTRGNQAGMVAGSTGYELDTKAEYIYENSAWRLKTPYAEFTATSAGITTSSQGFAGSFSLDTTQSTSSVFITTGSSGQLILTDPGIYMVTSYFVLSSGALSSGRTFADISNISAFTSPIFRNEYPTTGGDRYGFSMLYRTPTSNTSLYFSYFTNQASATFTFNTRIKITRLG